MFHPWQEYPVGHKEIRMHTKRSRQKQDTWRLLLMLVVGGGLALGPGRASLTPVSPHRRSLRSPSIRPSKMKRCSCRRILRLCVIFVADGVTLEFKNIRVTSTGATLLRFIGLGVNSRLLIRGSTFETCDNDILGFGAGVRIDHSVLQDPIEGAGSCDLVEMGPSGNLEILSSTLRTLGSIHLFSDNTITIEKSTLQAEFGISIGTGAPSPLHTRVEKSEITTGGSLEIRADQDTTVLKNDFDADSITITGDPCTSKSNTPDVPCS